MEIMKKSVKDFLKEREEDLKIPFLCTMRGYGDKVEDVRVHYSKKCKCFLDFPSFYAYKDEKENEYILFKSKRYSLIKYIWKKIEKMSIFILKIRIKLKQKNMLGKKLRK